MLFKKNLDGILSGFTKIKKDLDLFIDQGQEDLGDNEVSIAQLEMKREELAESMTKALVVRDNISSIIGE